MITFKYQRLMESPIFWMLHGFCVRTEEDSFPNKNQEEKFMVDKKSFVIA